MTKKRVIILALFVACILLIRISGISDSLTFGNLQRNREVLEGFVKKFYLRSVILYIAVYFISNALSIPGAGVLTLAGGFLFGAIPAAFYVNIGATFGATVSFLLSRYLIGDWIQKKYSSHFRDFNEELSKNGHFYLLTLRFVPVFPFFLINFISGLTKISLKTFIWTTSLGIIPGSLVYAFTGSQLGTIKSADDILSPRFVIAFLLLALFSLSSLIVKKIRSRGRMTGNKIAP